MPQAQHKKLRFIYKPLAVMKTLLKLPLHLLLESRTCLVEPNSPATIPNHPMNYSLLLYPILATKLAIKPNLQKEQTTKLS